MRLRPGQEAEYRRRHAAVWPELLADLSAAGASNYSIFLDGEDLFGYLEVEDFEAFRQRMAGSDANARWQPDMSPLIDPLTDPGDRVPPPDGRGLPPRLGSPPTERDGPAAVPRARSRRSARAPRPLPAAARHDVHRPPLDRGLLSRLPPLPDHPVARPRLLRDRRSSSRGAASTQRDHGSGAARAGHRGLRPARRRSRVPGLRGPARPQLLLPRRAPRGRADLGHSRPVAGRLFDPSRGPAACLADRVVTVDPRQPDLVQRVHRHPGADPHRRGIDRAPQLARLLLALDIVADGPRGGFAAGDRRRRDRRRWSPTRSS